MCDLRFRLFWLGMGWMMLGGMVYLSLMHHPPQPFGFRHADKLEHLLAYLVLMGWFAQLYTGLAARLRLALGLVALGLAVEVMQGRGGFRNFEWADLAADACGIGLAWGLSCTGCGQLLYSMERRLSGQY